MKQEQIQEQAEKYAKLCDPLNQTLEKQADVRQGFIAGAKWMQEQEKWIKWEDFKYNGGTNEMLNDNCLIQFDDGIVRRFGEEIHDAIAVRIFLVPEPPKQD